MVSKRRRWFSYALVVLLLGSVVLLAVVVGPSSASGGDRHPATSAEVALEAMSQPSVSPLTGDGLDIDPSSVTKVGSYDLPSGGQHEVYRAKSRNGWNCILEERPVGTAPNGEPLGIYGGGCSSPSAAADALKISISGAGDVDAENPPAGLSIVGVAGPGVTRVAVRMRSGALVTVPLNATRGFHFAASSQDGAAPAAVVAFDARGRTVAERAVR